MFSRFVFDGVCSDEYGIRCVSFESGGKKTYNTHETNLETEKSVLSSIFNIISQEYDKPLEYTIQIVNRDYSYFSPIQERTIKKWLCRKNQYKLFTVLDKRYADIWFYANINNPKSIWVNDVNGLEFTVTTNAPVAFSDIKEKKWDFDGSHSISVYVDNDEELPIYPSMIIIPKRTGNLKISNQSNPDTKYNTLQINNVIANEIITIDANYPLIESNNTVHNRNIYNDFNKEWFYFIDGYNMVQSNLPCTISFKYREYRNVGLV